MNSKEIEAEIKALEEQAGQSANEAEISFIKGEIDKKREEYWRVKAREEEQVKSERVEIAKGEATNLLLTDETFKDMPPSVIQFVELAVELAVKTEQEANAAEKAELVTKYEDKIRTLINQSMETEDQLAQEKNEIARITEINRGLGDEAIEQREKIRELQHENEVQLSQITRLVFERDEALKVRDNANSAKEEAEDIAHRWEDQLNTARNEIERLESEIADYRKAKVFGEKEAQKIINVQSNDKLKELAEQIIKEYKVTADVGLYKEITDAEGNKEVVRITDLTGLNIVNDFTPPDISALEVLPNSFPETQTNGSPMDQGNVNGEVEAQAVGENEESTEVVAEEDEQTMDSRVSSLELNHKMLNKYVGELTNRISALENSPMVLKESA